MIPDNGTAKNINAIIKNKYGCDVSGRPMFRLSWSDTQLEKRFGVFNEFYGELFIREVRGLREVKKYPYIKAKWLLERLMPAIQAFTPEVPSTCEGSYEPVYVFQDDKENRLPVIEEMVHAVIHDLFHPILPGDRAARARTEEENALEKELAFNRMMIEDAGSGLGFKAGEAVSMYTPQDPIRKIICP